MTKKSTIHKKGIFFVNVETVFSFYFVSEVSCCWRKPSHTLSSCHCQVVEKAFLLHSVPRGHGNLLTLLMTDGKSNVRAVIAEQECDRLRWESVARLTVNRPVKSDIRFQSSPLSSLQQLPWEPKCHFSPLFVYLIFPKPFIPFY